MKQTLELAKNLMIICLKGISEKCFLFNVKVNANLKFIWALEGLSERTQALQLSEGTSRTLEEHSST